ncbi:HesB/YadR/YfhF family protein [Paenibacillus nasutitermitis]|uniref:FeS cluster biogenesis domain-containing protein n=1 Tax=Paenibacillus nasutitermitis TaxID=1652958 RepID=A0A916YXU8_9BACL|nr:hypothetical protein [Paenibacillus nasutitermitis]GGD66141.1 hypothetical protein GCM10010911_24860 [Paenibacillus nasutitermitis]
MRIVVEQPAALWYKREMSLTDGDSLKLFVRLGGCGSVQPGFSLGVIRDTPGNAALQHAVEGIVFYMEDDHLWYLDNKVLHIRYDEKLDDIWMEVQ